VLTVKFDLRVVERGGALEVGLVGELDLCGSPRLRECLMALLATMPTGVIVNMARLEFLDATGIGVLIGALNQARRQGSALMITNARNRPLRVLQLTGLAGVFHVARDDVDSLTDSTVERALSGRATE
jgi:anti-sigma B factor antagonist